jgi:hypothetical protein
MFQPLDDLSGFGPDNPENPAQCWQCIIDELLRIRSLKDDWDGEGSEAPHPALVDGAITLAQTLLAKGISPPDRVHASVNATVYFEWLTPLGYTEIEVISPVDTECRSLRNGATVADVQYLSRVS